MATIGDLLKGSLRLIGAIAPGETPTDEEMSELLISFNSMVEFMSLHRLLSYTRTIEEFDIVTNQGEYTYGPGGDLNSSRPIGVERAFLKYANNTQSFQVELEVLDSNGWADISLKGMTSTVPSKIYFDQSKGASNVFLWPVPLDANKIIVHAIKPFCVFSDVTQEINFPPGYERLLRYNFAVEVAPEFGVEAAPTVQRIANTAIARAKTVNIYVVDMSLGALSKGKRFNIYTGENS